MRFHTNTHTRSSIADALQSAKDAGQVPASVYIETCSEHRSTKRARGFEISLRSFEKVPGDKRRRPNPGTGERGHDGEWAATWDEWGWFIAALFDAEPDAIFGNYDGQIGFDTYTSWKFCSVTQAAL